MRRELRRIVDGEAELTEHGRHRDAAAVGLGAGRREDAVCALVDGLATTGGRREDLAVRRFGAASA